MAWTGVRLALFRIKTETDLMPDGLSLMLFIFTPDWVRREFLKKNKQKNKTTKKNSFYKETREIGFKQKRTHKPLL